MSPSELCLVARAGVRQVFVFHLPGMVHHVKGSMPEKKLESPGSGTLAGRVVFTYCLHEAVTVRRQSIGSEMCACGDVETHHARPVALVGEDVD